MTSMAKTILDHRMALFYSLQVLRAALQQTPYSYPMLSSHSCHLLASLSSQLPTDNSPMIPPVKSTLTAGRPIGQVTACVWRTRLDISIIAFY